MVMYLNIKAHYLSMYDEFVALLRKACSKRKLRLRKIGTVHNKRDYHLYKIVINSRKNPKASVCFSAGIHGEEIAGPYAALRFIEKFDFRKFKNIKIIILPIANPYGFDRTIRETTKGLQSNGHFCNKRLNGEHKILYNAIKDERLLFFHALHEDSDEHRFYIYNFENGEEKIYNDILAVARKYFPLEMHKRIYGSKAEHGLIINEHDSSFEDRMYRDGVPYSMCTETPGIAPLEKRIRAYVEIMGLVLGFAAKVGKK